MDTLKDKAYGSFDYTCRYTTTPYYYDTINDRYVFGVAEGLCDDTSYVSHEVVEGDTFDSLALEYYNNPSYWWIIAGFNKVNDPFISLQSKFTIIKIPAISSIKFGRHN